MLKQATIIGSLILPWSVACDHDSTKTPSDVTHTREAEVELDSAEGSEIEGKATLQEHVRGVKITLKVNDAPTGAKGVHIHQKGDCSDIPGQSMGGHFSPSAEKHALPAEQTNGGHHMGDMGNIQVSNDGNGTLEFVIENASLREGDPNSLIGRALVVHEGTDHGEAKQPSGGSGKPIACGVIEKS